MTTPTPDEVDKILGQELDAEMEVLFARLRPIADPKLVQWWDNLNAAQAKDPPTPEAPFHWREPLPTRK